MITAKECLDFRELTSAISQCIERYDNSEPTRTIWLLGDSHAFTLLNGIRQLAKQEKSNLRVIARRSTAFPLPPNYLKLPTKKDSNKDRISFRIMRNARKVIVDKVGARDVLLISLRYPIHFGPDTYELFDKDYEYRLADGTIIRGSKRQYFKDWLFELEEFIVSLRSKNAYLIIVGPVPEWENAKGKCDPQWFRLTSGDCMTTKDTHENFHKETISSLNNLSERHPNFRIANVFRQICLAEVCGILDYKGENLYWDDDHLNDYAAINYVAPALRNATGVEQKP